MEHKALECYRFADSVLSVLLSHTFTSMHGWPYIRFSHHGEDNKEYQLPFCTEILAINTTPLHYVLVLQQLSRLCRFNRGFHT